MNLEELLVKIKNELKLRNFSPRTVESYLFCLKEYCRYVKNVKREPDVARIKSYLLGKDELTLHIKEAKGKKDRITIFPERLKDDLARIIGLRKMNEMVFESERGGKLTERTTQIYTKVMNPSLKRIKSPLE